MVATQLWVRSGSSIFRSASLRRICIRATWPAAIAELMLVGCEIIEDNLAQRGSRAERARQPLSKPGLTRGGINHAISQRDCRMSSARDDAGQQRNERALQRRIT